ncbi:MAG: type IIA DNA topoisomerase subunit B [Phycisphaeraceae bacterium]|nr:type IIA DNA topoisomerase subunit B [Phycisphaeraceae bacterium]
MTATYTAKDISVLEGLDPVRKRPGMYIGGVGSAGLHHLVWEILDNSVDEAMNGFASEIIVTLHDDGTSMTISDNGRGIPVDLHPKLKKSALEIILTTLHAGGKFEGQNYKTSGGLHGVGASVVNALSKKLIATVKKDGKLYEQTFKLGKPVAPIKKMGAARGTGTSIYFHPDPTIFPKTEFNPDTIRDRLEIVSYIHKGIKVIWDDKVSHKKEIFQHDEGILNYLTKILAQRNARPVHDQAFVLEKENGARIQVILQWTESTDEHIRSYVNGIPTSSGGSHENGLRAGLTKALRNYIDIHKLTPRGVTLQSEDLREGLTGIISIFIPDPQFQGQTKDRLNNQEVQPQIDGIVRPALEHWLNNNGTMANAIVTRAVLSAKAREASRAASAAVSRKSATSNRLTPPGKLADCSSNVRDKTELFIVEGDSAGGSAKQGRDRAHQAILPLRGKVLNTEQANLKKVLENKEISDIITALGCGIGADCNPDKLRYGKIILLMDADYDGHHISTLMLTFFYRHMRPLMREGKIFLAQPPLFRIDIGKETHWVHDDKEREKILAKYEGTKTKIDISRFKGLGEMMPKVLWNTTLNPKTRALLRVEIEDGLKTEQVISELMGKDPQARFDFIMNRAEDAEALDV